MSVIPTDREAQWLTVADTLPPSTVQAVITRLTRVCTDEAVEARALPSALLSVAAGHPVGIACRLAQRQAAMDLKRETEARERAEQHASLLANGHDVPCTARRWEDVRSDLPTRSRVALDRLAAHLLASERVWERLSTGTVKVNGAVVAEALGIPTAGLSKRKVADVRAASLLTVCASWAQASVLLGNAEDAASRAAAAHRWVKRGHSNRSGRVAGSANGAEVRVTRRLSVSAGFTAPNDGEPVRSVSYRPTAPVKRIRSPRTTDGVAEGVSWGGGGAVGMPSREGIQTLGHSDRKHTESGWVRATRDDAAVERTAREDWETDLAAGRVGICPTVDDDGLCQCPRTRTRGKACERVALETRDEYATRSQRARLVGDDVPTERVAFLHPLAPCESPTEDGRCGCARKAGALVWVAPSPESAGSLRHPSQPRRTR